MTATALNPFADVDTFDGGSYIGGDKHSEADAMSSIASKADRSVFYGANSTRARTVDELGPYEHKHTLVNKKIKDHETDDELTVVVKGDNVFGTTVSKSFTKSNSQEIVTVSISVASYRVVEVCQVTFPSFILFSTRRLIILLLYSQENMGNMRNS